MILKQIAASQRFFWVWKHNFLSKRERIVFFAFRYWIGIWIMRPREQDVSGSVSHEEFASIHEQRDSYSSGVLLKEQR
jgi:hypothetical protein